MDLFADHREANQSRSASQPHEKSAQPWKVLIVDDDEQVHQVTRLALGVFQFQGRKLKLLCALSGQEARKIICEHDDIALALVDVVMETEHAGLDLIKYIREELNDHRVRLVLRTGQAGQAPEDMVIKNYEIDDYKEKTELTVQKLKTLLYSMLRAYRDLCMIEDQKQGLSQVIKASAYVQDSVSLQNYASSVLSQVNALGIAASAFYGVVKPRPEGEESRALTLAATGGYVNFHPKCSYEMLPDIVSQRCQEVLASKENKNYSDAYVLFMSDEWGLDNVLYLSIEKPVTELQTQLIEIYMHNIALTFENLNLIVDAKETSRELVYNLANAVEARSKETGAHVERVSLYSERLAELYGLPEAEVNLIKSASPLHDVGKVAIPDSILHKPGKLTAEEWTFMQKHVEFGFEILSKSKRKLILVGKEIAGSHHEKWDGTGYPDKLSGKDIPISGRITALADVFDALGSIRCYKEAWPDDEIMQEIVAQKGKHFEPELVDLIVEHWDEFIAIRDSMPD